MSEPMPENETTATLARWREDETAVRSRAVSPGVAPPEQFAGKTGLQIFEAMLSGALPPAPIAQLLDLVLVEASFGRTVFQGRPMLHHYNPLGTVHGGWFATLLDCAVGCAVHTALPAGKTYTTAELKVNFVRPLTVKVPLVRAIGAVIHVGGRLATADARMVGADGKLYAHASTTCFIFDTP